MRVPVLRTRRYPEGMALQVGDLNEQGERVVELFAGFIPVTAEGKARARVKLDEARARMTPEKWAELRAQFGVHPRDTSA